MMETVFPLFFFSFHVFTLAHFRDGSERHSGGVGTWVFVIVLGVLKESIHACRSGFSVLLFI